MSLLLPDVEYCASSELLKRVIARQSEWGGIYDKATAGMPFTLSPLDQSVINNIKMWMKAGCYVKGKMLCSYCK